MKIYRKKIKESKINTSKLLQEIEYAFIEKMYDDGAYIYTETIGRDYSIILSIYEDGDFEIWGKLEASSNWEWNPNNPEFPINIVLWNNGRGWEGYTLSGAFYDYFNDESDITIAKELSELRGVPYSKNEILELINDYNYHHLFNDLEGIKSFDKWLEGLWEENILYLIDNLTKYAWGEKEEEVENAVEYVGKLNNVKYNIGDHVNVMTYDEDYEEIIVEGEILDIIMYDDHGDMYKEPKYLVAYTDYEGYHEDKYDEWELHKWN
jgi:hypothetical protein